MKQHQSFTNYLEEIFMEDYHGTKDGLEDAFERWLEDQDTAHIIEWGDHYGLTFKV
jgi:hypothetical protein